MRWEGLYRVSSVRGGEKKLEISHVPSTTALSRVVYKKANPSNFNGEKFFAAPK